MPIDMEKFRCHLGGLDLTRFSKICKHERLDLLLDEQKAEEATLRARHQGERRSTYDNLLLQQISERQQFEARQETERNVFLARQEIERKEARDLLGLPKIGLPENQQSKPFFNFLLVDFPKIKDKEIKNYIFRKEPLREYAYKYEDIDPVKRDKW